MLPARVLARRTKCAYQSSKCPFWIPDVTPSPDRNQFLHGIVHEVEAAANEVGVMLK